MSRTAQDVLEFDKLRELLRLRTTCAPGRRACGCVGIFYGPRRSWSPPSPKFVKHANGCARNANWVSAAWRTRRCGWRRSRIPARCWSLHNFWTRLRCWILRVGCAISFARSLQNSRCLRPARRLLGDFRDHARGDSARDPAERRNQRRCITGAAENSRQHRANARVDSKNTEANSALAQRWGGRRLRHTAQRSLCDSSARRASAQRTRRDARSQRHWTNCFPRAARNTGDQQSARAARRRRSCRDSQHSPRSDGTIAGGAALLRRSRRNHRRASTAFLREPDLRAISTPRCPSSRTADELSLEGARHAVLENKLRRENRAIVPMSLTLGGAEKLAGDQRPKHRRQNRRAENHGHRGSVGAIGDSRGGAARRAADFRSRSRGHRRRAIDRRRSFDVFRAHAESQDRCSKRRLRNLSCWSMKWAQAPRRRKAPRWPSRLLDEFRAKNCIVLATTHHDRLKTYASTTPGVVNAAVEFDDVNLRPTYRLMVGVPGGSSGIAIAQRLGLASPIYRARSLAARLPNRAKPPISSPTFIAAATNSIACSSKWPPSATRSKRNERSSAPNGWSASKSASSNSKTNSPRCKSVSTKTSRAVVEAVKERELRAQLEKSTRRKIQDVRGEAREELNAASCRPLSESQADLGVVVASRRVAKQRTASAWRADPCSRLQQARGLAASGRLLR